MAYVRKERTSNSFIVISAIDSMATYDSLHRQCRTLESLFDAKLTAYSRLASTISQSQGDVESTGSSERWEDVEHEIDDLLEKVWSGIYSRVCVTEGLLVRRNERAIRRARCRPRFTTLAINDESHRKT